MSSPCPRKPRRSWLISPIALLKSYLGIEDRDTPRAVSDRLTRTVLALDRALEPTVPALTALLDAPVDDREWPLLDPPQRRRRTLDGVKRLLLRVSQERPLLLLCEDLHWIDGETQALLDSLVESLPATPLLLVVTYRPEYSLLRAVASEEPHLAGGDLERDPVQHVDEVVVGVDAIDPEDHRRTPASASAMPHSNDDVCDHLRRPGRALTV